jgi:hypothetical protein
VVKTSLFCSNYERGVLAIYIYLQPTYLLFCHVQTTHLGLLFHMCDAGRLTAVRCETGHLNGRFGRQEMTSWIRRRFAVAHIGSFRARRVHNAAPCSSCRESIVRAFISDKNMYTSGGQAFGHPIETRTCFFLASLAERPPLPS